MEPSSELSVLESPKKGLGRPPNKKPRYLTNEQRKEKEEREMAQKLVAERERREAEVAEAKRREIELREAEKKRYATAFKGLKDAGFSTTYEFLRGSFTTSDVATSSAMGRLLQTHGEDFFNVLAKKNPELADDWAHDRTLKIYQEEARRLWKVFRPTAGADKLSLIAEFSLEELMDRMDAVAPHLINLLLAIGLPAKVAHPTGGTDGEGGSARRRDSRLVICTILFMLGQSYSERNNEFQILMGLYLLACGTPRRQFDVLAHAGLAVSYSTALEHLKQLSKDGLAKAREVIRSEICAIVWDNLNIAFRVGQQRISSKDSFQNGTTATLIPLFGVNRGSLPLSLLPRRRNRRNLLDIKPHLALPLASEIRRLNETLLWHVRSVLLDHSKPLHRKYSDRLGAPPAVLMIPLHESKQYPLPAMHIDESSLDGTLEVIKTIMREHLGMSNEEIEAHGLVFGHGDNLTISLIDKAQSARRDDKDTFESLRWLVPQLGLFHVKMAACRMTLNQHWGKPNSKFPGSLWKENSLLGRKTITAGWKAKKLPPFPPAHELLHLSLRAHILDAYRLASSAATLEDWIKSKPSWEDIERISTKILEEYFSAHRVEVLRREKDEDRDVVLENTILFNRDALLYTAMVAAVKRGDIGCTMDILAHWMVMMRGTGSMPKYADALLEVRLVLESWPEELKTVFVTNWLVNLSGKEGGCKEVDLLQEHHNFWAKIIYLAKGSNKSWEWLAMVTVCIFQLREVMRKVQAMYDIPSHGTRHTNPDDEEEIQKLMDYLKNDKVQEFCKNREGNDEIASVTDLMAEGWKYADTAKAFRNFKKDTRVAENHGINGGENASTGDGSAGAEAGDEADVDGDDDAEDMDLGGAIVTEDDLAVDDEEFGELAETFITLATDICSNE